MVALDPPLAVPVPVDDPEVTFATRNWTLLGTAVTTTLLTLNHDGDKPVTVISCPT